MSRSTRSGNTNGRWRRGSCRWTISFSRASLASACRQPLTHEPMEQFDRLQRARHNFEMGDQAAVVIEGDDIDGVDHDTVYLGLKLQNRAPCVAPFVDQAESRPAQNRDGACEVFDRNLPPALRREDDRTFEH